MEQRTLGGHPSASSADLSGDRQSPPLPALRLAMRAANRFLLDAVVFAAAGRDVMDNLILLAIVQANVAPIMADPELQLRYAAADSPPPNDLRRPISINAIAASLRLPFETVRRRVVHLAERGECEITARGIVVPDNKVVAPAHVAVLRTNYEAVGELYRRLRTNGCLPAPAVLPPPPASAPLRAVARLSSDLVLRLIDRVIMATGSLTGGLTLLAVFDLNTRVLPDRERGDERPGPDGFVPDAMRRPASVRAVSERLGLPYEQTRRRLSTLAAERRCTRVDDGYMLTSADLARAEMMATYRGCFASLQRMFSALAELGVLTEWERELSRSAPG